MPRLLNSSGPKSGKSAAPNDVCGSLIPTPVGPTPTLISYLNISLQYLGIPTQFKILFECMPAHNLMTSRVPSLGNFPGILLGVASKMVMGPDRHMMGSPELFIGGPPATGMCDPTGANGMAANIPGVTVSPSQLKVFKGT
jgi:hypothetical protein